MENIKSKTANGLFWNSLERFSVQGVQFVIGIIIARILTPSDYGLVGMLTLFLAIAQSLVDSGFSNALIRKQNRSKKDLDTVFYFNVALGLLLYLILFLLAPYIAEFYGIPLLKILTRVVSLNIIISSVIIVPQTLLTINIDFKTQMKATFVAISISGVVGIVLAYKGFGVWALATQSIVNNVIIVILLWFLSKWRPRFEFSTASLKELFAYSSKLLFSGLLYTVYNNIYTLIIGKKFSKSDLGYYTRANNLAQYPSSNLTAILQKVTFPILSSIQDDDIRLKKSYRQLLRLSAFVIFPLMTGLVAVADPLIRFILTDKWANAIPLLQILCLAQMWYPVHAINLNLLQVKGRSDLFFRLELIKIAIGVLALFITVPLGITAMCVGLIVTSIIALVINTYYTGKLIGVTFFIQMKDLLPTLCYSFSMAGIVWAIIPFIHSNELKIAVGIIVGIIYYVCIAYLTRSEELNEIKELIAKKLRK